MRVSLAGLMLWEVKVREGRERAAAHTLELEDVAAFVVVVGEEEEGALLWPCFGACRCSCRAFARAFSWVRTKYARFWRAALVCED